MSVSLVLLPVALALRMVMGKEKFEKWVESMQVKIPTSFADEKDLVVTVRKAGYDAERWGGSIKTHVRGEEFFFFWDRIDGVWTAVFAKADAPAAIAKFCRDLEKNSGRQLFRANPESGKFQPIPTRTFPTDFRDSQLLIETLRSFGLDPLQHEDGQIVCQSQDCKLTFRRESDEPFSVEVKNAPDLRPVQQQLVDLHDGYCQTVQARTYENLKSRVEERGMTIEDEEVLDDNSIVITVLVN